MPKERFHLLLADECLKILEFSNSGGRIPEDLRQAYLLGSIMPDTLYYDLPYFAFSPLGRRLHRFEGEAGLKFFRQWLDQDRKSMPLNIQFWILGMVTHYLSDGFWHPIIRKYSRPNSWLCRNLKFSSKSCHYWMESQLESYWLPQLGPPDGFCDTLKMFQGRRTDYREYFGYYRKFLLRAGSRRVPRKTRIQRCFYWQTASLQLFAHPRCDEWKSRLLDRYHIGQSVAALVVPPQPAIPFLSACAIQKRNGQQNPCDGNFLAGAISLLASRLRTLPVRL